MKKNLHAFFFFAALLLTVCNCHSQNLIANGDFETYTKLPDSIGDISMVVNWTKPTAATPDYFNINATAPDVMVPDNYFGSQPAHSGDAYCGIITYSANPAFPNDEYREYLQQHLSAPLQAGKTYFFEYYVSRAGGNLQHYATDKMGIYFSSNAPTANGGLHIGVTPDFEFPSVITDSVNWTKIEGCYTAGDNIQYVTIGNFRDNNNVNVFQVLPAWSGGITRSYYYIDDVSLTELKVDFDYDNAICNADVVFSNHTTFAANYIWNFDDGSTDSNINAVHHYDATGTYDVTLTATSAAQCKVSFAKTVEIKNINHHLYIPNAFTPNDDGVNDFFEIRQAEFCEPVSCTIYNRWGQKVFEQSGFEIKWNGKSNSKDAGQGIYFYSVNAADQKYTGMVAVIR
ncbi:MAG: gliding motility-associated C-terminal domain-containing protein [Bacteroidia bacterium]